MDEVVRNCKVCGDLTASQCYISPSGHARCKLCRMQSRAKDAYKCKKHGVLTLDLVTTQGRCRLCHRKTANKKRNNNREWFNNKQAIKRSENQSWTDEYNKIKYQKLKEKYGKLLSLHKQCLARGITVEKYNEMVDKQNDKCLICHEEEKRKNCVTKKPGRLTIDHCHKSNKVRGLLCHNCNVALGSFRDDPIRMYRAIRYIKQGGL